MTARDERASRVAIVGSGSLARAVGHSIATVFDDAVTVHVVGRSRRDVEDLCYVAAASAAAGGMPASFRPATVDPGCGEALSDLLAGVAPDVVVLCASHHSPWESDRAPSAWTALVARAGFGVTLPLQAALAVDVAGAVADAAPEALFVNACFPDAVNPLLRALGRRVLCGIGNVALVAASLRAALRAPEEGRVKTLAHHVHLHRPARASDEARAWLDGRPVPRVGALLAAQRAAPRRRLNAVGGHAAAVLVRALVSARELRTHVPGLHGLPGGYPVVVRDGAIELDLPPGVTESDAVRWNRRMAALDGVVVSEDGDVSFSARASEALSEHVGDLAGGFHASDVHDAAAAMIAARERLRAA